MTSQLAAQNLSVGYGSQPVVRDLSLEVNRGEVVGLLGPNGAGKTTTLLALSGVLGCIKGEVQWEGKRVRTPLHKRARAGMSFVTEERGIFRQLSTRDNLRVAKVDPDAVLELFPELERRLSIRAGLLSGGEQQMLALGRALSRSPKCLLIDELSLGLAPLVVTRLLNAVRAAANDGVAVLLVEQHVQRVLEVADRVYVLRRGQLEMSGTPDELRARLESVEQSYLAGAKAETPADSVAEKPANPVAEKPANPVAEKPANPVAEKPANPTAQAPASHKDEEQAIEPAPES